MTRASDNRNDPGRFSNGAGYRRKVVNQPHPDRFVADPVEVRARELLRSMNRWLDAFDALHGRGSDLVAAAERLCEEAGRG